MRSSAVLLLLSPFICTAQDFDTGIRAYLRGDYAEAVKQLRPLAEQGDANAQIRLGWLYDSGGPSIPADLRQSTDWFLKAAEQGIPEAQVILGLRYETGQGVTVDEREAQRWFLKAAQSGNAGGQYRLGTLYANSKQMSRDYDEALKWIRKAADQNDVSALKELELMRLLGLQRLEDYATLFTRWKVRAEHGNANAQFAIGLMYDLGRGIEQEDWDAAIVWYRKAAEKGILRAAKYLAQICESMEPDEAVRWYKIVAQHGDADAALKVAERYRNGLTVIQSDSEALKWYLRAGQLGNVQAEVELGMIYGSGRGVRKNPSESFKWFRQAAEKGNQLAQVAVGEAYELGDGAPLDYAEAMKWYGLAVENATGGAETSLLSKRRAQTRIGLMYFHGAVDDPSMYSTAVNWLHQPAEQGDPFAQSALGEIYLTGGRGVTAVPSEAAKWHLAAGAQGKLDSQIRLAQMYRDGRGVEKNEAEARKWNLRAAEQLRHKAVNGDTDAQFALGEILLEVGLRSEAVAWLRKSAERRTDGEAEKYLGGIYDRGDGVPQDYAEAAKWFQRGAEKGDLGSQVMLGSAYANGKGVPQDSVLAYKWYNIAGAQNPQVAEMLRDGLAATMTPQQLALAQALSRQWRPSSAASAIVATKPPATSPAPLRAPKSNGSQEQAVRSGTGFLVTYGGDLVTNYHVVKGCAPPYARIAGTRQQLSVIATDQQNDLALLRLPAGTGHYAVFNDGQRLVAGRSVVVVGFPLMGLLASGANITTGVVSALAGIGDDSRMLQITAPVQPGNSGGPLLDQTGNVVGVVVGKLNALTVARKTGDIPQNVNFAIKGSVVRAFLDVNAVKYAIAPSNSTFDAATIGEHAVTFTVPIECLK